MALGFLDGIINFLLQFSYFGVFLISLIGTMTVIIPVPYTFVILMLSMRGVMDPFLLTVAGGLGSGIGESFGYLLGYYGRALVSEERQRKLNYIVRILEHRYGSVLIFLFALTPLPDDLLFIPLGIMRYNFVKVFIPCFLGKLLMCSILAYGGQVYYDVLITVFGKGTFEIELLTTIITAILFVLIFVALFKIDWEKVLEKYIAKGAEKKG